MNTNEVLNPIKWRARIIKGNVVVLQFFVENNRTIDINLPINKLKQITQIFREIIGRTSKDDLIKMDWDNIIFQFNYGAGFSPTEMVFSSNKLSMKNLFKILTLSILLNSCSNPQNKHKGMYYEKSI